MLMTADNKKCLTIVDIPVKETNLRWNNPQDKNRLNIDATNKANISYEKLLNTSYLTLHSSLSKFSL